MEDLQESEAFYRGLAVGISLYQQKIIAAHDRKEPLEIDGESYFIQDGKELLRQMLDEICR